MTPSASTEPESVLPARAGPNDRRYGAVSIALH